MILLAFAFIIGSWAAFGGEIGPSSLFQAEQQYERMMNFSFQRSNHFPTKYATNYLSEPYFVTTETMNHIKTKAGKKFKRTLD